MFGEKFRREGLDNLNNISVRSFFFTNTQIFIHITHEIYKIYIVYTRDAYFIFLEQISLKKSWHFLDFHFLKN